MANKELQRKRMIGYFVDAACKIIDEEGDVYKRQGPAEVCHPQPRTDLFPAQVSDGLWRGGYHGPCDGALFFSHR